MLSALTPLWVHREAVGGPQVFQRRGGHPGAEDTDGWAKRGCWRGAELGRDYQEVEQLRWMKGDLSVVSTKKKNKPKKHQKTNHPTKKVPQGLEKIQEVKPELVLGFGRLRLSCGSGGSEQRFPPAAPKNPW